MPPETKAVSVVKKPISVGGQLAKQQATIRKSDFYTVQGKERPNAKAMQKMGNAQNISTEVLRLEWYERNNFYLCACTAYVKAWIGPASRPKQVSIQALTLSMPSIIQRYVAKQLSKGYWKQDDVTIDEATGRLMPVSKAHQMAMLSFLSDQFTFIDRGATTKAEIRAIDKMLRPEAMVDEFEDVEVDSETGEVTGPPPPSEPPPTEKDPKIVVTHAAEDVPAPDRSFPPSEAELAEGNRRVEQHTRDVASVRATPVPEKKPEPPKLLWSSIAQGLADRIDGAESRTALGMLNADILAAKNSMDPTEHGRLMQHFWSRYEVVK